MHAHENLLCGHAPQEPWRKTIKGAASASSLPVLLEKLPHLLAEELALHDFARIVFARVGCEADGERYTVGRGTGHGVQARVTP